jgi:hypothetical protein
MVSKAMKRTWRIQVRVETNLRKKIERWAAKEGVPPAELSRRIFEWAFDQYARAGDLGKLRSMAASRPQ